MHSAISIIPIAFLLLTSCASVHQSGASYGKFVEDGKVIGNSKKQSADGIRVSASSSSELSTRNYRYLQFALENVSDEWVNLDKMFITTGSDMDRKIQIVSGPDLASWAEAIEYELSMKKHNRDLFWGTVLVAGAAMSISGDRSVQTAGLSAFGIAGTAVSIEGFKSAVNKAEGLKKEGQELYLRSTLFPSTHILGGNLRVPANMFLRKWLVLYSEDPKIWKTANTLRLEYEINGNKRQIQLSDLELN